MALQIRSLEATPPADRGIRQSMLEPDSIPEVLLRFAIEACDSDELEALRHARRSMLREESTRGREDEEPSLEDAVFSPVEISWRIRPEQERWCLQKVEELSSRANRCLAELQTV